MDALFHTSEIKLYMLRTVQNLLGLIRFSHTVFALPFALGSSILAWHRQEQFEWVDLLGILLCMVFARSAAMAFNRLVDRDVDALNPRTAKRHLPAGDLRLQTVVFFTIVCCLAFIAATAIFLLKSPPNPWPLYLSIPVLIFILVYSWTKRFTSLAHLWLGVSLSLTPIAAWIAIRGLTDADTPLQLALVVLFWVTGFDILYACQDADFDRSMQLHSIPARFGIRGALRISAASHLVMFFVLIGLNWTIPEFGWLYGACLVPIGGLLLYQHRIIRPDDLGRVNQAFFQTNAIISIGLLLIIACEVWWV